jgi:hypothetical protein
MSPEQVSETSRERTSDKAASRVNRACARRAIYQEGPDLGSRKSFCQEPYNNHQDAKRRQVSLAWKSRPESHCAKKLISSAKSN